MNANENMPTKVAPAQPASKTGATDKSTEDNLQVNDSSLLAGSPDVLTTKEAANALRIKEATVRDMCRQGILPAFKLNAQWRLSKNLLEQYINQSIIGRR